MFNSLYLFAAWPRAAVEDKVLWQTRSFMTRTGQSAIRYEHALLSDRPATIRNRPPLGEMQASGALVAVNDSIVPGAWWEPCKSRLSSVSQRHITYQRPLISQERGYSIGWCNVLGQVVRHSRHNLHQPPGPSVLMRHHAENSCLHLKKRGRRCLRADHHEALVEKLNQLTTRRGWELNILTAEELTPEQQINITARSTVRTLRLTCSGFSLAHTPAGHSRRAWQWPHAPPARTSWVRSY